MTVDRRPMGSGSIEARGGRYRVRLRVAGTKRTLGTYATRDEADGVLAAALAQLELKRTATAGAVTLRDWVARWLVQRETGQEVRSTDDDASRLRCHVLTESWADDPIETVGRATVQDWVRSLMTRPAQQYVGGARKLEAAALATTGEPLSRTTIGHIFRALRVCMRDALEAGLIDANPCDGVRVPKGRRTDEPWTWLRSEEIAALLSCSAVPLEHRRIYAIAILTGLRKGELWGLRWGDVDLSGRAHVMVRRSYDDAPKNGKHRRVPLLAVAADALAGLRGDGQALDALVFPARAGGMRRPYDSAGFAEALRAAGITRHVRFHDLRHTCASHLLQGTWERRPRRLEDVRAWLGHSSIDVTERYAHLAPDYLSADDAGPTVAPDAGDSPAKLSESLSHLRELNPRPTVYEIERKVNGSEDLGPIGAAMGPHLEQLAVRVLEAVRAGAPVERLAADLAAAVLEHFAARPQARTRAK